MYEISELIVVIKSCYQIIINFTYDILSVVTADIKSVLNLQMTYIIIAHIYEQWDR